MLPITVYEACNFSIVNVGLFINKRVYKVIAPQSVSDYTHFSDEKTDLQLIIIVLGIGLFSNASQHKDQPSTMGWEVE